MNEVSLYAGNPIHLNDDQKNNFPIGEVNIPKEFFTFRGTDQQSLEKAFDGGHSLSANELSDVNLQFSRGGPNNAGSLVTFSMNLYYALKSSNGIYSMKQTSLSCEGIPVYTMQK